MKKNKIIPAILVQKWNEIEKEAKRFADAKIVEKVQIDFCDGKFVPNTTWPFVEKEDLSNFEKIKNNFENNKDAEIYLPEWETLSYAADIMCENPIQYFKHLLAMGFSEFVIHFRSIQDPNLTLTVERFGEIEKFCSDFMIDLTISIDIKTDLEDFIKFTKKFENSIAWKQIQIMGIENIGVQGESFDERVLEIIKKIKTEFPEKEIMMDGGMNSESIEKCKKVGAKLFVVGSALHGDSLLEKFKFLQNV
jgi:pentose-5-phosphate-3-epimerase